jgi:hypothetical protein
MRATQKKAARLDGLAAFFVFIGRTKEKTHNGNGTLRVRVSSQPLEDWIYLSLLCSVWRD